ncbi:uncharacterized protein PITG_11151 [Phytophthora infestans T30-4]|uniref:Uncharacterized protein n=1 Tax=Phytophthora infestans (strain T30-4) TaxID=403677 RepID=D0NGA8_PHYIT|nr:uncharacterized protein PITG_11151 [Phytophthora infestans T30-4]EEY57309.1 hypothetical protein PITG_11151 [Phytophthora infestans T30-4]|eukprot:XP_002901919.1 hypothetical protein PITG_11151 [Phytophthora infestans T30-4]
MQRSIPLEYNDSQKYIRTCYGPLIEQWQMDFAQSQDARPTQVKLDARPSGQPLQQQYTRIDFDENHVAEELGGAYGYLKKSTMDTTGAQDDNVFDGGGSVPEQLVGSDPFKEEMKCIRPVWMDGISAHIYGWTVLTVIPLFHVDPTMQLQCSFNIKAFYVDLFSQWGLFKKQQSPVDKAIHPDDLTSSWNGFVIAFKRSPSNWIEMSFNTARKKFIKSTMLGHVMDPRTPSDPKLPSELDAAIQRLKEHLVKKRLSKIEEESEETKEEAILNPTYEEQLLNEIARLRGQLDVSVKRKNQIVLLSGITV